MRKKIFPLKDGRQKWRIKTKGAESDTGVGRTLGRFEKEIREEAS